MSQLFVSQPWPFGPYDLLRLLGVGGMAEVYLARPRGSDDRVVVKRVRSDLDARPDLVTAFVDEALLVSRLRHENIVGVLDVGSVQGAVYMALELVDGPDVRRVLVRAAEGGPAPSPALSAWIVARAADGLHFAHEAQDAITRRPLGIVHRDVSPQNILLSRDGLVKVADFGIALTSGRAASSTDPGHVKGKHGYISPEQARGEVLDRKSDLFSLGVVLYELLTREKLFKKRDDRDVVARAEMKAAPNPRQVDATLDADIASIVARALAPDRAQRFDTAGEFARALDRWTATRLKDGKAELARFVEGFGPSIATLPPARARDLDDEPRSQQQGVEGPPRPTTTPFVGREHELESLRAAIAGGARLVVVVADEGAGGTRLLRAFAPLAAQRLAAKTRTIDLHRPASAALAAQALALAVGASAGTATVDDLVDACARMVPGDAATVWLIDDASAAAGPLVSRLLAACPALVIVATARAPLFVEQERVHALAPLAGPARPDELALSPAGRVLLSRADAARGVHTDAGERPAFAELARRAAGSPLALEVTAGRTCTRTADELGRDLTARIPALPRDHEGRRAALAACIEGALDDLSVNSRRGLLRLAAYAAPFSRAAAAAVLDDGEEVFRMLGVLAARALVVPAEEARVEERFAVHAVVARAMRARSPRGHVEEAERLRAAAVACARPLDDDGRRHLVRELLDIHARGLAIGSPAGIERALRAACRAASLPGIDVPRGAAADLLAHALAAAAGRGVRATARHRALDALGRHRA